MKDTRMLFTDAMLREAAWASSQRATLPVHQALQLLERQENQNRSRLETRPCRKPAFEHKHRALIRKRCSNHAECRLVEMECLWLVRQGNKHNVTYAGSRSARVHDATLKDIGG